jgi:plastocyanin
MRRTLIVLAALAFLAPGCAGGGSTERTVRVDYQHDEFASHYWRYFPGTVEARPGDTVVFEQEWTGEPHTVTFGRIVDEALPKLEAIEASFERDEDASEEELAEAEKAYEEASEGLPIFDTYQGAASQAAAQPCYLDRGQPPTDPDDACRQKDQPEFDGSHAYYSSGFIPPSGSEGNEFRMPIADDAEPGTYNYYCVIHFPFMQGKLEVRPRGSELPSADEVNARARNEIEDLASPLRDAFADARRGRAKTQTTELEPPLAGYHAGDEFSVAIDEFVPKMLRAKVDEPITWTIVGAHTISFDVPRYLPVYQVLSDGTVERNAQVDEAAGGAPKAPRVDFTKGPLEIDGGTWDGSGFYSSGLIGSEPFSRFTLRVSKAGSYRYACLVHPKMVARLVVTS